MFDSTCCVIGDRIRLLSGRYLSLTDPQPDQFTFEDIVAGISKECRFTGQLPVFYSVAEHSLLCRDQAICDNLSEDVQRACLMHDAAEGFFKDLPRPLKRLLPEYGKLESRMLEIIAFKFDIDFGAVWPDVRKIDNEMCLAERRRLIPDGEKWEGEDTVRVIKPKFRFGTWEIESIRFRDAARELGVEVTI